MNIEEARLYLEHTSKDDFNLEEWQKENRYQAIQVILREIERLNNIINTMLEFNLFAEECPLNLGYTEECAEEKAQDVFYEDDYCEKTCNDDYKKCWLKYFERLQELKGSESNDKF